jgi:hypothetical protein
MSSRQGKAEQDATRDDKTKTRQNNNTGHYKTTLDRTGHNQPMNGQYNEPMNGQDNQPMNVVF